MLINNKIKSEGIEIPSWMYKKNKQEYTERKAPGYNFVRKTLINISKVIQNEVFSEVYAFNGKFLQMIDPRVKLITLLIYMIFSGLAHNIVTLMFLALVTSMYVKFSGLGYKKYLQRVWMIIPLFVLFMSIPAATSIFIKGKPFFYIYKGLEVRFWHIKLPSELFFTLNGIVIILKMSLRIGVSISLGYLLIMTTRWSQLTKSLRILRVPSLVISILNMTYRYIYVLSKMTFELFEARFLRTVGKLSNKGNRKFISNRISFLFVKSSFLSEEIYDSMRCRGYTGETVSLNSFKLKNVDYIWILNNFIIALILVMGELL